jgi:hypothetical protein
MCRINFWQKKERKKKKRKKRKNNNNNNNNNKKQCKHNKSPNFIWVLNYSNLKFVMTLISITCRNTA